MLPQQVGWLDGVFAFNPKVKGSNCVVLRVIHNGMLIEYFSIECLK
jgi:hypothetical protein